MYPFYIQLESFFASKWKSRLLGISVIFFILLALFAAFRISGHIVFGDLDFGFILHGYIDRIFPLWNSTWSTATFFNGTRLPLVGILYNLVSLVSDNPSLLEKAIIFSLLFLSGVGMFVLVSEILRIDKEKGKLAIPFLFIFLISLGSALYYAFNPWSIIRIQHIYLLVGYAFLPFIFYEILYLTERINYPLHISSGFFGRLRNIFWIDPSIFRHIVFASILYIFAIGAVHYLFFVFFFIGSWYLYRAIIFAVKGEGKKIWYMTYYFLLFGLFFLFLLSYWILPYIGASLIGSINPPSINTIDSISSLARYSTFRHVLYLASYWWPMMDIENLPLSFWIGGGFVLFVVFIGNILNIRNKLVVYFLLWSIALIILSTGTKIEYFADFYKWIVFDNPVAGQMGFIFRDSNKLVGLLAFTFAILWGTGLAGGLHFILQRRKDRKEEIDLITRVKYVMNGKRNFLKFNGYTLLFLAFIVITIASYTFYLRPFYTAFFQHFYLPITIPSEYTQLIQYERDDQKNPDAKYLYLPRYEGIISPGYQFGVATWNHTTDPQRPTSSLDLYTSVRDTYNPLEGATTYLGHFYEYIDYYLTNNIGTNLAKYLAPLGIEKIVYHSDLVGLNSYQKKQVENLGQQKGIKRETDLGFFSLFSLQKFSQYFTYFPHTAFLFGGIENLETLFGSDKFNFSSFATVFVSQDPTVNDWKNIGKPGDTFVVSNKLDLLLSTLKKEDLFSPFDSNNYSDAFSRWAKLREDVPDWKYHLKKLGITNWPWDFSLNRGFIFTYAPAMLNLEPYEYTHNKGKDLINFKDAVDIHDLFISSDTNSLQLVLEKTDKYAEIPAIKGEVIQGGGAIWRAGIMKPIEVKERTAHSFEVVISGKGVKNIHGKVKFLDTKKQEIGVDYVSAPRYAETFDLIKFSGNFITPIGAKYIIFELNSQEIPEAKTYWWIHDIKIKELSEYTKPNIVKSEYEFKKSGMYKVFVRSFHNIRGGSIGIHVGTYSGSIDTESNRTNRFEWSEFGTLSIDASGKRSIEIENIRGFNAVNVIAFIPIEKYTTLLESMQKGLLIPGNQIIALEAENDFDFSGNITPETHFPFLSNGQSVNLENGILKTEFDIVKESDYSMELRMNPDPEASNYRAILNLVRNEDMTNITVNNYRIESDKIIIPSTHLMSGHYSFSLDLINKNIKKVRHTDMRRLDIIRDHIPESERDPYLKDEIGCSYNAGLYPNVAWYKTIQGVRKIGLWPGFSCYWLISTHDMVPVHENEEYLVRSNITQLYNKNLHSKIRFLNTEKETIETMPLDSYETEREGIEIDHQQIITTPPKAAYMQVHFWQRQRQDKGSLLSINDFFIERYHALPGLDNMIIYDTQGMGGISQSIFPQYSKKESMERNVSVKTLSGGVLQMTENFSPLWRGRTASGNLLKPIYTSLFLNGYILSGETTNINFNLAPKQFLTVGVGVSLSVFIILLSILGIKEVPRLRGRIGLYKKNRQEKKDRIIAGKK